MKIIGLIVVVLGWVIAVSSVTIHSTTGQFILTVVGLAVSIGGVIGILNRAHLAEAIWKK